MRTLLILSILVILSACASTNTPQSNQSLAQWEGKSIDAVVKRLGSPNQTFVLRTGNVYYVYVTKNYQQYPSSGMSAGFANLSMSRGGAMTPISENQIPQYGTMKCALLFQVNQQKTIISTQTRGNNCYSSISYLNGG